MKTLKSAINWFEIPATDIVRARKFYETIFDLEMIPLDIGDNVKMALFPVDEGTIGGSLCQVKEFYIPSHEGPLVYLNANPDLQVIQDKVEKAGGKVLIPKRIISEEHGYMAVIEDPEGNRVALHSDK